MGSHYLLIYIKIHLGYHCKMKVDCYKFILLGFNYYFQKFLKRNRNFIDKITILTYYKLYFGELYCYGSHYYHVKSINYLVTRISVIIQ